MSPVLEPVHPPIEALTTNQWLLEIAGTPFASFSQVAGLVLNTATVQRTDGGTGLVYTFPAQNVNYGNLTFTRQRDPGDPTDPLIDAFVDAAIDEGTKVDGEIAKLHFRDVLFRFRLVGLLFFQRSEPTLNKGTNNLYEVGYTASVDFWEEIAA